MAGFTVPQQGDEQVLTSESLRATTRIRGWLSFLVFSILVGSLVGLVQSFVELDAETLALSPIVGSADIVSGLTLFALAWTAAVRAWRRSPDAVFWLRAYLVIVFASNVASFALNDFSLDDYSRLEKRFFSRSLVWSVTWLIYTFKSIQVADIFPKVFRRTSPAAVLIAVALALLPFAQLGLGIVELQARTEAWETPEFAEEDLEPGFCTDGHVVFRRPSGATASLERVDDAEEGACFVCRLEGLGEDGYVGVVTSLMYTGESKELFATQREAFTPDEFGAGHPRDILDETRHEGSRTTRMRIVAIEQDGKTCYWRFAMVFDRKARKTTVLHFVDSAFDGRYFTDLTNSVRATNP